VVLSTMNNKPSRLRCRFRRYSAYGVSIRSEMSLPLPIGTSRAPFQIREHPEPIYASIRKRIELQHNPYSSFAVGSLSEGSNYVGLRGVGECLVSRDGRRINCYRFPQANPESFNIYLLTQALSFALVKNGMEPLHATAVVVKGAAVAFLGDCGFGKSTLAAEFLKAGHRLLTDDLLILRKIGQQVLAYPGPPRIKLLPKMTSRFLGDAKTVFPMNPRTRKLIVPLRRRRACSVATPFAAFYLLPSPDETAIGSNISITTLSRREAFRRLLAGTFNISLLHPTRLQRQFEATEALANSILVKELSYPRALQCLPRVRKAILSDLVANPCEASPCVA
jgi:HPr Serine kinase C-terminal domain